MRHDNSDLCDIVRSDCNPYHVEATMDAPLSQTDLWIHEMFDRRDFAHFLPAHWSTALKSLIREDAEHKALCEHVELAAYAQPLPNLGLSRLFISGDRDLSPLLDTMNELMKLSPAIRPMFSAGVDGLVQECLARFAVGTSGAEELLTEVMRFENYFGGGIFSGVLAEEVALNRALSIVTRRLVIQNLHSRSFTMAVSDSCWTSLEKELSQTPAFAGLVMTHLVKCGYEDQAMELPLTFTPEEDDYQLKSEIVSEFVTILEMNDLTQAYIRATVAGYPEWAMALMREAWVDGLKLPPEDFDAHVA